MADRYLAYWPGRAEPRDYDLPEGSPVPGSIFVRAYCVGCGDPIRVGAVDNLDAPPTCETCRGTISAVYDGYKGFRRIVRKHEPMSEREP